MKKIYLLILIPITALSVLFFTLPKAHAYEENGTLEVIKAVYLGDDEPLQYDSNRISNASPTYSSFDVLIKAKFNPGPNPNQLDNMVIVFNPALYETIFTVQRTFEGGTQIARGYFDYAVLHSNRSNYSVIIELYSNGNNYNPEYTLTAGSNSSTTYILNAVGSTISDTQYEEGYNAGVSIGYESGHSAGYVEGLQDAENNPMWDLFTGAFAGVGALLDIELLPNISIGLLILIPMIFGVIAFILGKRGGGD